MPSDEEIERLEREIPDIYKPRSSKVIWERSHWKMYYTKKCNWPDVQEGDCKHPNGWHGIPARIRTGDQFGVVFEVLRRRRDGEPGEVWSPMRSKERKEVERELLSDRLNQMLVRPDLDQ